MNLKIIICLLFILVIIIPTSFASDEINQTEKEILDADSHIYFNASAAIDGSGSQTNPYKTLDGRISSSYTHYHFSPGLYTVSSKPYYLTTANFIGSDAENTVIEFTGSGNFFSGVTLNFTGITLKNINIVSSSITASDTIFDSAKADVELETSANYDYGNSYGGAIKISGSSSGSFWDDFWSQWGVVSPTSSNTVFDRCVFKNNYAAYGGAFYIDGARVNISNSRFMSNHAPNGGGAISAVNGANLTLTNCTFDSDYSSYDAGVVYLFNNTKAVIKNSQFNNCSAALGSAVTSINSQTTIISSNFTKNKVTYAGGAVYAIYGALDVEDSIFEFNFANIAGAIYADGLELLDISNCVFRNNEAIKVGGAIISCANNNSSINNKYGGNKAEKYDDLYESDYLDVLVGSGDYEMIVYNSDYNGNLPSKYDLRDYGYVTALEDQNNSGNCWAYATIAALESCILKATGKTYDLSEGNLKNIVQRYSNYGWNYETNEGGFYEMVLGYLTGWLGPVNASQDPSDDWDVIAPVLNSVVHIQNILFLQRSSYTDNNKIKEAIMKYGAVATEIYMDFSSTYYNSATYGYYVNTNLTRNHAVCVVGWDDTYSRNNFRSTAPGDGAWIIKNSYGTRWGNNGYGYVSYYDQTLFSLKQNQLNAYTFIFNDTMRFDKNYQYDFGYTDYFIDGQDTIWCKNTYISQSNDNIAAFSTFFNNTCDWQAFVYVNDELKHSQNGTAVSGYYTFNFNTLIPINHGDKFSVVLKIHNSNGYASFAISEKTEYALSHNHHTYNQSFYSQDGIKWIDLYGFEFNASDYGHLYYSQSACLKVFTSSRLDELSNTSVEIISYSSTNINVSVKSQGIFVNSGNVEFIVDNQSYIRNVKEGISNLDIYLPHGNHNVEVVYLENSYYATSNISQSIFIDKEDLIVNINLTDMNYGDVSYVNIYLTDIDGDVVDVDFNVSVNDTIYSVFNNEIILENLSVGEYNILVNVSGSENYNDITFQKSFNVLKLTPKINVVSQDIFDGEDAIIKVNLSSDIKTNITLVINNETHTKVPIDGVLNFTVSNLPLGVIYYEVIFEGDDNYLAQNVYQQLTVLEKIKENMTLNVSAKDIDYGDVAEIVVMLSNSSDADVTLLINNQSYTKSAIDNKVIFNINELSEGIVNYTIIYQGDSQFNQLIYNSSFTVYNKSSREIFFVVSNFTKYFMSDDKFIIKVVDIDSKPVSDLEVNITFNNKTYIKSTDDNGEISINVYLSVGIYNVFIDFKGNAFYLENNQSVFIKVLSTVEAANMKRAYLSGRDFEAKFFDSDGTALSNTNILFNINGINYACLTNSFGIARLNISLDVGDYKIAILNSNSGEMIYRNLSIVDRITNNSDIEMYYMDGTSYSIKLFADNGESLGAGENVNIQIASNSYSIKTNNEGIASLVLNLKTGKYTIVAEYKGVKVINNLFVKSSFILKAKNISKKKAKKIVFKATLKSTTKAGVKSKKITFKIKGKTYTAKTNARGVAKLTLKNLKVGKYTIYISYLKNTIKNKITIKK